MRQLKPLTPPDWDAWSTLQRVVYWTVLIGGMALVGWAAKGAVNFLFGLFGR